MENITLEIYYKAIAWSLSVIIIFGWIGSRLVRFIDDYEPVNILDDVNEGR